MKPRDALLVLGLLLPTLALLAVFTFYPAFRSLWLSFFEFDPFMTHRKFAGFANYRLLLSAPEYWQSLQVTGLFLLMTVPTTVLLSLGISLALEANPFCRSVLRTLFLLPVAISSAMAAMLWIFIFNPSTGILNFIAESFGLQGPNWLGDPNWALLAVSLTTVWKEIGFTVIFLLAGLSAIPRDLHEAAMLDGASATTRFRRITLPLLAPTILFVSVVSVLNSLQSFGQIHILTAGGPAGSTNTLVYNLYRDAFQNFQTGAAAAQAVLLFALMLIATMVQFHFAKRSGHGV